MLHRYKKDKNGAYAMSVYQEYCALLHKWNSVHNLSGAKTQKEIEKNIDDSLYPYALLKDAKNIVDIGSGAGFPGLILAMKYPEKSFVLVEPINKKASFLKTAVRTLGLKNVTVETKRIEQCDAKFDFVLSRAVAPTKKLLDLAKGVVTNKTQYLFYKGDEVDAEIEGLKIDYELIENGKRVYLYIKELYA